MARRQDTAGTELLLRLIDEGYSAKAWHGPNLRGSLRGVSASQAAERPAPGRHNIWEIAVHAAYWKYTVRRRITGEKRGSFPLKGSNWFRRPVPGADWKRDLRMLGDIHAGMREAVATLRDSDLLKKPGGSRVSNASIIMGIASHDIYHAGQIQFIKRLTRG
jgi:uncharacterized damage-inducible protein DinB